MGGSIANDEEGEGGRSGKTASPLYSTVALHRQEKLFSVLISLFLCTILPVSIDAIGCVGDCLLRTKEYNFLQIRSLYFYLGNRIIPGSGRPADEQNIDLKQTFA